MLHLVPASAVGASRGICKEVALRINGWRYSGPLEADSLQFVCADPGGACTRHLRHRAFFAQSVGSWSPARPASAFSRRTCPIPIPLRCRLRYNAFSQRRHGVLMDPYGLQDSNSESGSLASKQLGPRRTDGRGTRSTFGWTCLYRMSDFTPPFFCALAGSTYLKASGKAVAKLIGYESFGFTFLNTVWPSSAGSFASSKCFCLYTSLCLRCTQRPKSCEY